MDHRLEVAPSGRATCKTCGKTIAKGELRLGEAYESQFGSDGVAIRWHHLPCGAQKLPEVLKAALDAYDGDVPNRAELEAAMSAPAKASKKATGALPTADLAPTGRAKCIQCSAAIEKGGVRIAVEREVDTGAFVTKGAGYLHPACAEAWAESGWEAGLDDLIAQVHTNTGLDVLPPPFGTGEAGPDAAAKPAKKAAKPKADAPSEVPGFGALSGKQVAALAQKLLKLNEDYKADSLFEKAGIDWGQRDALRWHFVQHDLLPPSHPTLIGRLSESAHSAGADAVLAALAKMGKPPASWPELAPGWAHPADAIALRAFQLDPARLEKLVESVPAPVRTGIQLVRGRHGATLPEADRQAVLRGLAHAEASAYGISRTYGAAGQWLTLKQLGEGGAVTEPYRDALALARHFGTEEAWLEALAEACRGGKFEGIERVMPGLARLPLADMVAILAEKHISSDAAHDRRFAELLRLRGDAPEALVQAGLSIDKEALPGRYLREDLLLHGLAAMHARGMPLAPGIEMELDWTRMGYVWSPWRDYDVKRAAYRAVLEGLGRDRALALARQCVERGYNVSQATTFLGVHYDETILRDVLSRLEDHADPAPFALLGTPALPHLVAAMDAEPPKGSTEPKRLAILRRAIQSVLALEARAGRSADEAYDRYVSCEPDESYWQDDLKKTFVEALAGLPEERRQATIDRLFAETKQPERPLYGVHTVASAAHREAAARRFVQRYGQVSDRNTLQQALKALGPDGLSVFRAALVEEKPDAKLFQELGYVFGEKEVAAIRTASGVKEEKPFDRLLRLAREQIAAGRSKTRIYLLERPDDTRSGGIPAPRAGSLTRARGKGAGVDRGALKLGEREHILTLDVSEVPELARSGRKAIALYADDPEHGDGWDDARLVDVPEGAAAPTDGDALSVVPLEVPFDIFDPETSRADPVLAEIRSLVFNRPGYVLGQPMFIQEESEGGGEFVMQLAERVADLNLGDSGSLYVFEDAIFMQCY